MNDDVLKLAEATGDLLAAHMKVQASVVVALFSTLVRHGVLSAETVETEILTVLEEMYQSPPAPDREADHDADQREAEAGVQLIGLIRRRLFEEQP